MKKLFVLLSIVVAHTAISAQPAYRVSSCQDLGLNPITRETEGEPSEEILQIYLEGDSSGIGGRGCWAHHHPNGKDFVVTPFSWGRNPSSLQMEMIEDAMQAITDAKNKYVEYGTLNNPLYYLLNDVYHSSYDGIAYWLTVDNQCWMHSGTASLIEYNREDRKFLFAHEIGHCFTMENIANLAKKYSLDAWFDESVAEFLASELYLTNDSEFDSADDFDFNKPFRQEYSAYSLFTYYVREKGQRSLVPFLNKLTTVYRIDQRLQIMRELDFDELFHNYTFDYSQGKLKDSGSSTEIPRIRSYEMNESLEFDPATSEVTLSDVDGRHFESIELRIPAGFDATIRPATGTDKRFFQSLLIEGADDIRNWDSEITVSGNCGKETNLLLILTHLYIQPLRDLRISYDLEAKTNCCGGTTENMDGCLVGTWKVDGSTISNYVDQEVSGTLEITFESFPAGQVNATFDLRLDDPDNDNYDVHKGTLSACVQPAGTSGHLKLLRISGLTLGPVNIHRHWNSHRGKWTDLRREMARDLETTYNYVSCDANFLTILYMITMDRVR